MEILQDYSLKWSQMYKKEAHLIKRSIPAIVDIQHIGSTAIPGMLSKPIIDVGILVKSSLDAPKFLEPLRLLGYQYYPESSSRERHFFRKGDPVTFHLSLAYQDRGTFWERQISFRDYLRANQQARQEYIKLKQDLLRLDPTGGKSYLSGKSEFVENILVEAKRAR